MLRSNPSSRVNRWTEKRKSAFAHKITSLLSVGKSGGTIERSREGYLRALPFKPVHRFKSGKPTKDLRPCQKSFLTNPMKKP